jgi:hypothetical protein
VQVVSRSFHQPFHVCFVVWLVPLDPAGHSAFCFLDQPRWIRLAGVVRKEAGLRLLGAALEDLWR